jgi:hypothetical protein
VRRFPPFRFSIQPNELGSCGWHRSCCRDGPAEPDTEQVCDLGLVIVSVRRLEPE